MMPCGKVPQSSRFLGYVGLLSTSMQSRRQTNKTAVAQSSPHRNTALSQFLSRAPYAVVTAPGCPQTVREEIARLRMYHSTFCGGMGASWFVFIFVGFHRLFF